jgi:SOS-response transcriptional repressor LexA
MVDLKYKIYKDVVFNQADLLFLSVLEKNEILQTHRLIKKYSNLISKASASRAISKLEKLGIIEPISSTNYMAKHKRIVEVEDLGIITIPLLGYSSQTRSEIIV